MVSKDKVASKQICLYAMMRQYRLVWDFMLTVVGTKYRNWVTSFGKIDSNGQELALPAFNVVTLH